MSQLRHVVRQRDGITNHCHYIEFGRTVTVTFLDLRTMLYVCHPGVLHMSIDTIPMWIWLVPLLNNISSKSNELDPKTKGLWKSALHIMNYAYISSFVMTCNASILRMRNSPGKSGWTQFFSHELWSFYFKVHDFPWFSILISGLWIPWIQHFSRWQPRFSGTRPDVETATSVAPFSTQPIAMFWVT